MKGTVGGEHLALGGKGPEGERVVQQRREEVAGDGNGVGVGLSQASPVKGVPTQAWRSSGQEPGPSSAPGPCSGYHFSDSPPSSGLSPPLCQSSESSFLPAFSFFLSPHLTDCGSKMAQIYGSTHQK